MYTQNARSAAALIAVALAMNACNDQITLNEAELKTPPLSCEPAEFDDESNDTVDAAGIDTCAATALPSASVWVSPDGEDSAPGTASAPVRSLDVALDHLGDSGGGTINLADGHYPITKTVEIGTDCCSNGVRILGSSNAVLTSDVDLKGWSDLRPVDPGFDRIAASVRDSVQIMYLPPELARIRVLRDTTIDEFLPNARHEAPFMPADVASTAPQDTAGASPDSKRSMRLPNEPKLLPVWARVPRVSDLDLLIWGSDSVTNLLPVSDYDVSEKTLWTTSAATYMMADYGTEGGEAWVLNQLEALDSPGEWVVDTLNQRLYVIPIDGTDTLVAPALTELIRISGTADQPLSNVQIEGLTFTGTDRPTLDDTSSTTQHDWALVDAPVAAISMQNITCSSVQGATLSFLGGEGVRLDGAASQVTIADNHFSDIGWNGISLIGAGLGHGNLSTDNELVGNTLERVGALKPDAAAILLSHSSRAHIHGNLISDFPSNAISLVATRSAVWTEVTEGYARAPYREYQARDVNWSAISSTESPEYLNNNYGTVVERNTIVGLASPIPSTRGVVYTDSQQPGRANIIRFNFIADAHGGHGVIRGDHQVGQLPIYGNMLADVDAASGLIETYDSGDDPSSCQLSASNVFMDADTAQRYRGGMAVTNDVDLDGREELTMQPVLEQVLATLCPGVLPGNIDQIGEMRERFASKGLTSSCAGVY